MTAEKQARLDTRVLDHITRHPGLSAYEITRALDGSTGRQANVSRIRQSLMRLALAGKAEFDEITWPAPGGKKLIWRAKDSVNETEFQAEVIALCDERSLYHYHTGNPIGSDKGWPDLVIIGTAVLYRELKSASGILSRDQKIVGYKLKAARQDWAVWWPKDLDNGNIRRQLDAIT